MRLFRFKSHEHNPIKSENNLIKGLQLLKHGGCDAMSDDKKKRKDSKNRRNDGKMYTELVEKDGHLTKVQYTRNSNIKPDNVDDATFYNSWGW